MANSFTREYETVMGSWRVFSGTLLMTDGDAGTAAGTGLEQVIQVTGTGSQMARLTCTGSYIAACTAASAASYKVVVFGV